MPGGAKQRVKAALGPIVRNLLPRRAALKPAHWGLTVMPQGHLAFEGVSLASLREEWGSPLHVVLAERLRRNVSEFLAINDTGRTRAEFYYSYKSNPIPGVLRFIHASGIGAEVISEYELWLALKLGVPPDRIVFNGPAKSVASVRDAVGRSIMLLNVNHREEIAVVASAARELCKRPRIGVRAAPSAGWSGQFGLPIGTGEAFAALKEVHESGVLELTALQCHVGGMVRCAQPRAGVRPRGAGTRRPSEERIGCGVGHSRLRRQPGDADRGEDRRARPQAFHHLSGRPSCPGAGGHASHQGVRAVRRRAG